MRSSICTFITRRRFRFLSPALMLAIVLLLLLAPNVRAHARLDSSSIAPGAILSAAPAQLTLSFTEPVDVDYSTASLIDSTGATVSPISIDLDPNSSALLHLIIANPGLPAGSYAVVWRVLSATDGHATTGSLSFSAGTGSAPDIASTSSEVSAPWTTVGARWLEMIALLAIAGALAFAALNGPIVRSPRFAKSLRSIVVVSSVLGLVGSAVASMAIAIAANDRSWRNLPSIDEWRSTLTNTDVGRSIAFRGALFLAAFIAGWFGLHRITRARVIVAATISIAALSSFSLSGHARATDRPGLAIAIDLVHLSSAALWGGGIALLALFIYRELSQTDRTDVSAMVSAVSRFSGIALVAMGAIVASGIANAALHVSGPRNLTTEDYGRTLILKTILVLLVLVVAGTNRLFIVPRLRTATESNPSQSGAVRITTLLEVFAALLILFAAARLTELPPADGPLTVDVAGREGPIILTAAASELTITLDGQLDPAANETMTIAVTDTATGQPPTSLARVIVLATAPDPLDPNALPLRDRFDATPVDGSPGSFSFPRTRLGIQANWQIEITARRIGEVDASAIFPLDLTSAGTQPPRLVADHWRWPSVPLTGWLALAAAAATFAGGITLIKRLKGLEPVTGAIFLAVTILITGAFALSAYRAGPIPTDGHDLRNPLDSSDSGIVVRASDTFAAQCASCHGATGQDTGGSDPEHGHTGGDRDLTASQPAQLSDGDLYTIITNGIGGTEMPAFIISLTDQQRWELVLLIRQYQEQAKTESP